MFPVAEEAVPLPDVEVAAPVDAAPPPVLEPAALPDPIILDRPPWQPGIQFCELAPTNASRCIICKLAILRNMSRLKFQPNKSSVQYIHDFCADGINNALKPHSRLVLRYQRDAGDWHHDQPNVEEGIIKALAKLG